MTNSDIETWPLPEQMETIREMGENLAIEQGRLRESTHDFNAFLFLSKEVEEILASDRAG